MQSNSKEEIIIKLKNIRNVFLCIMMCIYVLNIHSAASNEILNWFLKYNSAGEVPQTPDNGKYTEKYNVISYDNSGQKNIYLTFDAGYENGNVSKILDTLSKQNVPGAFFVLPHIIKTNTELILRMKNDGHLICNHSKSHHNMGKISDINEFKEEIYGNEEILRDTLNLEMSKYFRPPEGAYTEKNLEFAKSLGYKTVFWSLAYADWDNNNQPQAEASLELLLSRVHPGCVVLLHPTSETNALILDKFISEVKNRGYSFKSLDEFPFEE